MKLDRTITFMGVTLIVVGSLLILSRRFIVGAAFVVIGFILLKARGNGSFNDRSQYEKVLDTNGMTVGELFSHLKDMNTPLGKPYIAEHKGYPGESIVFGPSEYKDVIVISVMEKKPQFSIKHITKVDNIIGADAERLSRIPDLKTADVNPASYSEFASYKVVCAVMLDHITEIVEKNISGNSSGVPEKLDLFNLYYYNSSEGYVKDMKGMEYMKFEGSYTPFTARTYDAEGAELTTIVPRSFDRKGRVVDRGGFDFYAESEHYADVVRTAEGGHDTFVITSGPDEFKVSNFAAVQRANIKSNYMVTKDGKIKAIIGGNPRIDFEGTGLCRHYVIMSYDDDYLVLYASFINFLMTLNVFIS